MDGCGTFDICDCCGVEAGYEDNSRESTFAYRAAWIKAGAKWFNPKARPADWDLKQQLAYIPEDFIAHIQHHSPAADEALVETFRGKLPPDYLGFLLVWDGGEGFLPYGSYVALWRASELEQNNTDYQAQELAPGLFLFASNGGELGYAFDLRTPERAIVQVPLIGLDAAKAWPIAKTFIEFLES